MMNLTQAEASTTVTNHAKDTICILIVDDDERATKGLTALLRTVKKLSNADIIAATNGQEALLLINNSQPDLVLLDVRMPGMDGIETTRQMKARFPQVKIIMHSISASYKAEALAAGADLFLIKGDAPQLLVDAVQRFVC